MDAELVSLAGTGATTLVTLMVTDGWEQVRSRVAAFFSRGREGEAEAVQAELESSRAELVAARAAQDEDAEADVRAEWRVRMRRTLQADPQAAAELRALLDELLPAEPDPTAGSVHNVISGGVQHGTVIQAHTIGDVNIGDSRR
ncbi:hypothetical protein OK074_3573 [Actinobacteria bacterium OK074]|nr:hypothetical protein OK074_3573 [Actinobacteria bacterium OK074]